MPRLLIPLAIVALGVIIYALVECVMTPKHQARAMSKTAWVFAIVLVPVVGALLWLFFGRARMRASSSTSSPSTPPPPRPSSPDDDEAFLRQLEVQRRQQARKAELDRREAELRAREGHSGGSADQGAQSGQGGQSGPTTPKGHEGPTPDTSGEEGPSDADGASGRSDHTDRPDGES